MYDMNINQSIKLKEYGIYIRERVSIPAPQKKYEEIEVVGRSGKLIKELGYEDIEINVQFNFFETENIPKKIRQLTPLLLNTKTISFTDDNEVFYKVKKVSISDISREIRVFGFFNINFTLEPFSYLANSFPIKLTTGTKLTNLGTYESEPYIKITGSGNVTLNINNKELQLKAVDGYIEIDSEAKETHKSYESMNHKKVGDYPVFQVGQNSISWTGTVTSVEIEPRWRCL